ncbi:S-adenosyl-L-methionine-dependent methyltransferase [Trichoderma sp. SZMC 28014]
MTYFLPETSQQVDYQHNIMLHILGGRLGQAPVGSQAQVLDVATGTGIWAMQYAQQHPESTVLGVDLSIAKPQELLPDNCQFQQLDAENGEWPPTQFDYIHFAHVISCFDDTKAVMKNAFDHMQPGGWIELHDPEVRAIANDDSVKGTALEEWIELIVKGGRVVGRDLLKSAHYEAWLNETGFVNVQDAKFQLPINEWPENPNLKKVGAIYKHNFLQLVESLAKFLTLAGLSNAEAEDLKERVRRDIHNTRIRAALPLHVTYAQKSFDGSYAHL